MAQLINQSGLYSAPIGTAYPDYDDVAWELYPMQPSGIPDFGSSVDTVDVTTIYDRMHKYINALPDIGGAMELDCFYDHEGFKTALGISKQERYWMIKIGLDRTTDSGGMFRWTGDSRVGVAAASAGDAIPAKISITPSADIEWSLDGTTWEFI